MAGRKYTEVEVTPSSDQPTDELHSAPGAPLLLEDSEGKKIATDQTSVVTAGGEPSEFAKKLASGEYRFPKGSEVILMSPPDLAGRSEARAIPADQAAELMLKQGWVPESPEQQHERIMEAKYGKQGGGKAFAEGAVNALTLGGFNYLGSKINQGQYKESIRETQQRHPGYTAAGELTGFVAPALASGGATLLEGTALEGGAKAVAAGLGATPAGLVSKIGAAGEIGAGSGTLQRILANTAASGLEAGVTSAAMTAGQQSLSDHPLGTAAALEELGTAFVSGAKYGAVFGAGTGTIGEIASKMGQGSQAFGTRGLVGDALRDSIDEAKIIKTPAQATVLKSEAAGVRSAIGVEKQAMEAGLEQATNLGKEAAATLAPEIRGFKQELAHMEEVANLSRSRAKAFHDFGGLDRESIGAIRRAEQAYDAADKAASEFFPMDTLEKEDRHLKVTVRRYDPEVSDSRLIEHMQNPKAIEALQAKEAATIDLLRAVSPRATAEKLSDIDFTAPSEIALGFIDHSAELDKRLQYLSDDLSKTNIGELESRLKDLEAAIRPSGPEGKKRLFENFVKKVEATKGIKHVGAEEMELAKQELGVTDGNTLSPGEMENAIKAHLYMRMTNQAALSNGLKYAPEITSAIAGIAVDRVFRGAMGIAGGGFIASAGLQLLNRELRNKIASNVHRIAVKAGAALESFGKGVSRLGPTLAPFIGSKATLIDSFFSPSSHPGEPEMSSLELYQKRAQELAEAMSNPDTTKAQLHSNLMAVRQMDPKLADKMEETAFNRLLFLYGKMPKNPGFGVSLEGEERFQPSDADMSKWTKSVYAADHPDRLLDELKAGTISPETVEAVKAVHPEMYDEIRRQVVAHIPEIEKRLSYGKRVQLQILFGVPVDSTTTPDSVGFFQQAFASAQEQQQSKMAQMKKGPNQQPSEAQRIEGRT